MQSNNPAREDDLLPFGAPQADATDPAVRAKLASASGKPQRSPRALRPLWYSIPFLVIALAISAYLIGITLWSRSSLGHWTNEEYPAAQAGYEGQKSWTSSGVEQWVAHYNLGTTLVSQDLIDEGVAELRTAYDMVPKAIEVQPGRLEPFSYECRVRVNLGLGIEIQGDAKDSAGAYGEAYDLYQESEDMVAPCQSANQSQSNNQGQSGNQGQGGQTNHADENKSRVQKKKQNADKKNRGEDPNDPNKGNNGGNGGNDPSNGGNDPNKGNNGGNDPNNGNNPGNQPTTQPGSAPTPDPYEGESEEERKRRQGLEGQNTKRDRDRREHDDQQRSGNPNGGW